jgi:hypothetical protein
VPICVATMAIGFPFDGEREDGLDGAPDATDAGR